MSDIPKLTLPVLELDLQKTTTFVARPFRMTQGDKGYWQPFHLSVGFQPYSVKADTFCFAGTKPDGQVIDIQNEPERFVIQDGIWYFHIPDEVTQAVGTFTGYFYIVSEKTMVASTTKFAYEVNAKFGEDEASNSYVTMFEKMGEKFSQIIESSRTELNNWTTLNNQAKSDLDRLLQSLQTQTDNWLRAKTGEVEGLIAKYNSKYNEIVGQWNTQIATQQSRWQSQTSQQQTQWQGQFTQQQSKWQEQLSRQESDFQAQKTKIDTEYKQALADLKSQLNSEWQSQKQAQQASFDSFKADLTSKISQARADLDSLSQKVPELTQKLDAINAKVRDVDFNGFVKSVNGISAVNGNVTLDVYSRADVDSKIANAGKVKTVQGQQPDGSGNVNLPTVNVAMGFNPTTGQATLNSKPYLGYWPVDQLAIHNLLETGLPSVYAKKSDLDSLGKVKTVNGSGPDGSGNVTISIPDVSPLIDSAIQKIHFKYEEASGETSTSIKNLDITATKDGSGNYIVNAQGPAWTARNVTKLRTTVDNMNSQISALQAQISALQTQMQSTAKIQTLTQAKYDALTTKDDNVIYRIKG